MRLSERRIAERQRTRVLDHRDARDTEHRGQLLRRHGDGHWKLNDSIREMVTFSPLNLAEDPYPSLVNNTSAMDIIYCRNVLIYFDAHH